MRTALLSLALVALQYAPAGAQVTTSSGFLFGYRPLPGQQGAFEEGYARHLEWHRAHKDSLIWHAWSVIAGSHLGMFVDGTFGRPFAAFDSRVDPSGDQQDARAHFLPYAKATYRELLVLREDLSTATPLETGTPSELVQVLHYATDPGGDPLLESALLDLRRTPHASALQPYTVYESLAGGEDATFVVMIWRSRFTDLDDRATDPVRALRENLREEPGRGSVQLLSNELWQYRPALTYQPGGSEE